MKLSDLLPKKTKRTQPDLNLRSTEQVTVKEVLEKFAPAVKGGTGCDLVQLGGDRYFFVIQGNQSGWIVNAIMQLLDQLQEGTGEPDDNVG